MADLYPASSCREKPYTYLLRILKRLLMYTRSCKLTGSHPFFGSATYLSGAPSIKLGLACSGHARWQVTYFTPSSVMKVQKSFTLSFFHQQMAPKGQCSETAHGKRILIPSLFHPRHRWAVPTIQCPEVKVCWKPRHGHQCGTLHHLLQKANQQSIYVLQTITELLSCSRHSADTGIRS